jgi:hypothetical protein
MSGVYMIVWGLVGQLAIFLRFGFALDLDQKLVRVIALFLGHVVEVLVVAELLHVLDRLASHAVVEENDLHFEVEFVDDADFGRVLRVQPEGQRAIREEQGVHAVDDLLARQIEHLEGLEVTGGLLFRRASSFEANKIFPAF